MPEQDRTQVSNAEELVQEVERLVCELQQRIVVAHQFDEFFRALWEVTKDKSPAEKRELFRQIAQEVYGGKEFVDPEAVRRALRCAMKKLNEEEAQCEISLGRTDVTPSAGG